MLNAQLLKGRRPFSELSNNSAETVGLWSLASVEKDTGILYFSCVNQRVFESQGCFEIFGTAPSTCQFASAEFVLPILLGDLVGVLAIILNRQSSSSISGSCLYLFWKFSKSPFGLAETVLWRLVKACESRFLRCAAAPASCIPPFCGHTFFWRRANFHSRQASRQNRINLLQVSSRYFSINQSWSIILSICGTRWFKAPLF